MYGKVRIQRPCNFHNRPTPFVVPWYSIARNDQIPRNSVQSVLLAFAPVETPPGRNGYISSRSRRQCRFETNRIARPEKLCTSRIITTLKERVKGFEIRTRSVTGQYDRPDRRSDSRFDQYRRGTPFREGAGQPEWRAVKTAGFVSLRSHRAVGISLLRLSESMAGK